LRTPIINICLAFNNNFSVPANVLISSILFNSNYDDQFNFYILDSYPKYYKNYLRNPYILHYVSGDKPWLENTKQDTKEFNFYLNKINNLNFSNSKDISNNDKNQQSYQFRGNLMNDKKCVYTVLIGNYEKLNEQLVAKNSNIDFICFTDDENLTSDTWQIINVDPIFPLDNIRSAREIKIAPHRYLQQYETSLYIDNSITLKVIPEEIFENILSSEYDFYCIKHSFRDTVLDEFEEVLSLSYDKQNTIMEQFNAYSLIDHELFFQKPYCGGFLVRNHNKISIINAMNDWLAQVMRYSRRDQLSLNYVIRKHNIMVKELELDIHSSEYHKWPTSIRYGKPSIKLTLSTSIESNMRAEALKNKLHHYCETIDELEVQLSEKDKVVQNLETLIAENDKAVNVLKTQIVEKDKAVKNFNKIIKEQEEEILFYAHSKSWRITRPLRKLMQFFNSIFKKLTHK